MPPKFLLVAITSLLLLINCFVIAEFDQDLSRWARLISTAVFFILLIWQNNYNRKIIGLFLFFLVSDILLFYYEDTLINSLTFLSRISAYLLLVFLVVPQLKNLKTNLFQKILFLVVLGLNLFMLVVLLDMVPQKYQYSGLDILFIGYGLTMIGMVITAISYSNRYASRISFYYTATTLFLVFSDITSFIGYYLEFYEFYYPDRIFYIMALSGLVKFTSIQSSQEPVPELERL